MRSMAHYRALRGLQGTAEIEGLQRALINLSVATQRPAVTAQITGVIDDQTMTALSSALGLLTEELPSWLYLALQAVMVAGATNASAKKYVGQYAVQLTMAANTAAVKYKVNPTLPVPMAQQQQGFFVPGWYKTPLGIALLIAVGFVGYKLFLAPKAKA